MPVDEEGVNRLVVYIQHFPEGRIARDSRQQVVVNVWPADKPTLAEKLVTQKFIHVLKELRNVANEFPG